MNSHPFRFAFVSNSLAVAEKVRDYAKSRDMPLEIRLANMEEAIPVARQLLKEGVSIILGGGGTGKLLRRHLCRPVVTIERTHLDILLALLKAREISHQIACTSYGAIPPWPGLFARLLDISITPVAFTSTNELVAGISQAVENGVGVVVGGGICVETALARGCPGVIVAPGEESLERAMDEALNIARAQQEDREQAAWLAGALDALEEGVVGLDSKGGAIIANRAAKEILPTLAWGQFPFPLKKKLGLDPASGKGFLDTGTIRRVEGRELAVRSVPVRIDDKIEGAISVFMPASRLRDMNYSIKNQTTRRLKAKHNFDSLLGDSPQMRALRERAALYAPSGAALHIFGESGTGKELLAHAAHNESPRKNGPFVAVNCASLPETLLESELFGYDEGAFTGARRGGKQGLFELANDGTIFLDEIGDISPAVQVRLLRVLETGEIFRLGGNSPIAVNARVISSSWKDIAAATREGSFRADLYYRLTTLRLETPALRHRPEDIKSLAEHIINGLDPGRGSPPQKMLRILQSYPWPGNVRELGALLRRYCLLAKSGEWDEGLLRSLLDELALAQPNAKTGAMAASAKAGAPYGDGALKTRLEDVERDIIDAEMRKCGNDRGLVARRLGISVNTLWRKMSRNR